MNGQGAGDAGQRRRRPRAAWRRRLRLLQHRTGRLPPTLRGLLWAAAAGFGFTLLNALMKALTQQLDPFQAQFLRYLFGLAVLLPLLLRHGLAAYRPRQIGGQFLRGGVHTLGLFLWFAALPKIALADTTAIGFTTPIFIMLGAWLFFREPMRWDRWLASGLGFVGVIVVVAPQLTGSGGGGWHLLMLASAPMFAASFLITKALTGYERTTVILLWQAITVSLFSLPPALLHWQAPDALQWAGFALCGALGSAAHYALTRSFTVAEISSTQSAKFLELVWAALLGWLIFAAVPSRWTLAGGALICAATVWIAHRESRTR